MGHSKRFRPAADLGHSVRAAALRLLLLLPLLAPSLLAAQTGARQPEPVRGHIVVGSEEERYVRNLQLLGVVPYGPWSVRPYTVSGDGDSARARTHPWMHRYELPRSGSRRTYARVAPISASTWYNSGFPYGSNDAAVWAGRGITLAAEAGVVAGLGPVSVAFRPIAFHAQNAAFPLAETGASGQLAYGDPLNPRLIDRPQRFGDGPYSRVDPGQSWVKLDIWTLTAGISTANLGWGPAAEYPFVLGNNAPGFAHAFFGTSRPINILFGRVHGRAIWGRLEQSEYSPVTGSKYFTSFEEPGRVRFASGVIAVFTPRFAPGLELGIARLFQLPWPADGIPREYFTKPAESFFRFSLPPPILPELRERMSEENQLASFFLRWALPASHTEFYAEYGREDHSGDLDDLLQQIDHSRTYVLGFRTIVGSRDQHFSMLRGELFNALLPSGDRPRLEGTIYQHDLLRQGHTHRGQLLGSSVGVGAGAATMLAWDRYTMRGRRSIVAKRAVQKESGRYHRTRIEGRDTQDVLLSLGFEEVLFRGRVDFRRAVTLSHELNRNFQGDRFNLNAHLGMTVRTR